LFALISMNQNPLFLDDEYAKSQPLGRRPVIDTLAFSLTVGMSAADMTARAIANLGYDQRRIRVAALPRRFSVAESEVLEKRESASKPDRGIVAIETRAFNQNQERILVLRRQYLVPKRGDS